MGHLSRPSLGIAAKRGERHAEQIQRAKRRSSPSYSISSNGNPPGLGRPRATCYAASFFAALIAAATPDCLRIALIFARASFESLRMAPR